MVGNVVSAINYITTTTDGCSPWLVAHSIPTTMRSNFTQASIPVTIQNLRNKENSVNLDTNALEVVKYNGSIQEEFEDGSEAHQTYFEEIIDFFKKHLGASRVVIYHYTFRSRGLPRSNEQCNDTHRNPVFYPHVDTDSSQVQRLVEKALGKEASDKIKTNRIQAMNVWRPLGPTPIIDNPLTICDYQSIDTDKDVQPLIIHGVNEHFTAYTLSRNAQDAHIWYYLSHMRSDEMFIFKMYDSKSDVAQYAFHTAFKNGHGPVLNEEQKSLELRCLIFYDD